MDERLEDLRSAKNPKARIKILKGHFATSHSHINTYIDMSTVKSRHNNARETAKVLAAAYLSNTTVDTIVCMEETEVIGTFLAEQLADENQYSLSGFLDAMADAGIRMDRSCSVTTNREWLRTNRF